MFFNKGLGITIWTILISSVDRKAPCRRLGGAVPIPIGLCSPARIAVREETAASCASAPCGRATEIERKLRYAAPARTSRDVQRRWFFSVSVRLDDDLYVLIERNKKAEKPLDGKLAEVTTEHLGYIGLADANMGIGDVVD